MYMVPLIITRIMTTAGEYKTYTERWTFSITVTRR